MAMQMVLYSYNQQTRGLTSKTVRIVRH